MAESPATPNQLVLQIQEAQLPESEAKNLENAFLPFFKAANEWAAKAKDIVVNDVNETGKMKDARELRLQLKDVRVNADKTRKELKAESLRKGKAIDGVYNIINYIIAPIEEHLQKQEDFAKIKEEEARAERKEERTTELAALGVDTTYYDLAAMPQDTYDNLLKTNKDAHEAKIAQQKKEEAERIEKERLAEEERKKQEANRIEKEKKDEEERKALQIENDRLKKEAEEKEAKEKKEREDREAAEKAEKDRIKKEEDAKEKAHQAQLEEERKKREALELQEKMRKEAEDKKKKEEDEKKRQLKLAPDKEKLGVLANEIATIGVPDVHSDEAKAIVKKAIALLKEASTFVKVESMKL